MPPRIAYVDGPRLREAVIAGLRHLIARREHLDHINVFPVPDADTGTNLAASARHIIDVLRGFAHTSIVETADTVAEAALMGGRGNSGAILAQFFQGLSDGLGGQGAKIPTIIFADAVVNGAVSARLAVSDPREGTILTVMREWAESFREAVRTGLDVVGSLEYALETAQSALARTPEQLNVLRDAHVVDAGAQGFLYLLEGVHRLIQNGWTAADAIDVVVEEEDVHVDVFGTEPEYRWCSECIVTGSDVDRETIRSLAESAGDSVVVAGSATRIRLHVHTDRPGDLFARIGQRWVVSGEKADDMKLQFRHANHPAAQKVCILTDTGCDLPGEILSELNIHQIPFRVSFGSDQYIDKVTLPPDRFYELLQTSRHHPKTAQPAPADFLRTYELVAKHYESVLSIHVPGALSGTLQGARLAARQIDERIRVIDSKAGSVGMGLIVLQAAERAREGYPEEKIVDGVRQAIDRLVAYYSIDTTSYLVKGGRISRTRGLVGRLLNVRVIFKATPEGEIEVIENLFRGRDPRPILIDLIEKGLADRRDVTIAIAHAAAPETAEWYAGAFRNRLNPKRILVTEFSPALGVHAGPGAIAVAAL